MQGGIDWYQRGKDLGRQTNAAAVNGRQEGYSSAHVAFPAPVPASALQKRPDDERWVWKGILAYGSATLLSALWKAGKSTLLSFLLKKLEGGGEFCGLDTAACPVLYVTEEAEDLWADRRDEIGLGDHVRFQVRPFKSRPDFPTWIRFLDHLKAVRKDFGYGLLVMDTISNLWPVKDENDNAQVGSCLMPLWDLGEDLCLLLNHHLRKSDGDQATGSRGAGAITAFADTIVELRRFDAGNKKDRRRVLSGYGRHRATPDELVVELAEDWSGYRACGDRQEAGRAELTAILDGILPDREPGFTYEEIVEEWPGDHTPRRANVLAALNHGVDSGSYGRTGRGRRGSPFCFFVRAGAQQIPNSVHSPIRGGTETETRDPAADRPLGW